MKIGPLFGLILILVALWLFWFLTGGPERRENEKILIYPPVEIQ